MICGLKLPSFERMIKLLIDNPTIGAVFVSRELWDKLFNEYCDYLVARFGRTIKGVPWVADGKGFPAFYIRGKIIIGVIL